MHDKLVFPVFISESARHIEDFTQRFGFYGNTGNLFFQEAVYRQLKNIEYAPWRELQHSADSVKEKWDCIVLSQANVLSPTNEISEGFLTFLEKANMPIVQIGMGLQANSFFEQVKLKPSVLRFLDIIKERSVSIGVRGYHTAEYLANMGIHNVDVIGCPTLYWHRNPQFQLQHFAKKIQHVGTNFTCRGSFIKEIRNFLKWSMKYAEGFVEQDVIPMLRVIEGLEPQEDEKGYWQWICPEGLPMTELQDWFRKKGIAFYDMEKWISYISNHYDFVIGGRIHGCMAAIQGNVPALLLALDQRTQELAQFMNIPYMNIYDFDDSLPPQHYYDNLDYSLFNATYIHRWNNYCKFLEKNKINSHLSCQPIEENERNIYNTSLNQILNDIKIIKDTPSFQEIKNRANRNVFYDKFEQENFNEEAFFATAMYNLIPAGVIDAFEYGHISPSYLSNLIAPQNLNYNFIHLQRDEADIDIPHYSVGIIFDFEPESLFAHLEKLHEKHRWIIFGFSQEQKDEVEQWITDNSYTLSKKRCDGKKLFYTIEK